MKRIIFIVILSLVLLCIVSCGNKNSTYKLQLNRTYLILNDSAKETLTLNIVNKNNKKVNNVDVTLSSSSDVVEINGLTLTAKKVGTAYITALFPNNEETYKISVYEEREYSSITDTSLIHYEGRININKEEDYVELDNVSSIVEFNFIGTQAILTLEAEGTGTGGLKVIVDGKESIISLRNTSSNFILCDNLENSLHHVKIIKMFEQQILRLKLLNIKVTGKFLNNDVKKSLNFEFYGDSITAGYGCYKDKAVYSVDEDGSSTYAMLLASHYNANLFVIAHSGVSAVCPVTETEVPITSFMENISYYDDTKFDYSSYPADIVFVNLGTNDANSPSFDEQKMKEGYFDLLKTIRRNQSNAYIICIYGNMSTKHEVNNAISNAVENFKAEIDLNICYKNIYANNDGTLTHPDKFGQQIIYEKLIEVIEENVIIKIK